MRTRLKPSVAKLVNKRRGPLSANDEVNRALTEYYEAPQKVMIDAEALKNLLGSTNTRRFLRPE